MPRSRSIAIQTERTGLRAPPLTRQLDRPAKQQHFFGHGGLAGVGMRDDRKRPPARNLVVRVLINRLQLLFGCEPSLANRSRGVGNRGGYDGCAPFC
jgi:hypothetical protein